MENEKKCRLVKDGACGKHRQDEKCVRSVGLNASFDCVDGRITVGQRKSSVSILT